MKIVFIPGRDYSTGVPSLMLAAEANRRGEERKDEMAFSSRLVDQVAGLPGISRVEQTRIWSRLGSVALVGTAQLNSDEGMRRALVGELIGRLMSTGARFAPLSIVDWLTEQYRLHHPPEEAGVLLKHGPDEIRFERIQQMRLPSIEPWLQGRMPVRDIDAFNEFHHMSAAAQALTRLVISEERFAMPANCPEGCHVSPMAAIIPSLASRGWLALGKQQWGQLVGRGPRIALLNQAANEMMAD